MTEKQRREMQGEDSRKMDEAHDEGVLNPEKKGEADLSSKERRQIEKEKLAGMGMKKKLEYIWMYYKAVIFGIIGAIILVCVGVDIYQNAQIETVLSIAVVNAGNIDSDTREKEIKDMLGYTDKNEQVEIGTNLITEEDGADFDYYAQMAYVTQLQAGSLDVMIVPEALARTLADKEVFTDMEQLLGEADYASFGTQENSLYLALDDAGFCEAYGLAYQDACIMIPVNSQHQEDAVKWIASLKAQ